MAGTRTQNGTSRARRPSSGGSGFGGGLLTSMIVAGLTRLDGFANSVTGLGYAAFDKTMNALFLRRSSPLSDQYLEGLYEENAFARRICDLVPDEMTRPGFDISLGSDVADAVKVKADVMVALRELAVLPKLKTGKVWENVFGGGAVMLDVDEGRASLPSEPLDETRVRRVRGLIPIERARLIAYTWYPSTHARAGMPELWMLQPLAGNTGFGSQVLVHESRLLIFPGGRVTHQRRIELQGWGFGLLQAVHDVLTDYEMSWRGITHMLQSANQDVWTMNGFKRALADGDQAAASYFAARFQMAQQKMGPNRAILLDSDGEQFQRFASQFTGVPDTMLQVAQRICAVTGYPATKLFGTSPAGMNATGESDAQNWYATVAADRVDSFDPNLRRVIRLVMLSSEGPTKGKEDEGWDLKWHPFQQLDAKELAELRKTTADTDAIYIDRGLPIEVVITSRFRPDGWSPEMQIDTDAYKALVEVELERLRSGGDPNTPDPNAAAPMVDPNKPTDPNAPAKAADTALQGAQMQAMLEIVQQVVDGQLPPETAIAMLVAGFDLTPEEAASIINPTVDFEAASKPVPPQFAGNQPPPSAPPKPEPKPGDPPADPANGGP